MKHLLLCDYDICYVRGKCRHCDQSMNQEMFNEEHVQLDEQNESVNRGTNLAFCRYCDQFMNNRIWHLYSFCIPNVTYEHLLKTPNVIWTHLNTECDIWTPFDKYRMWQVDWGCIPTESRIPYWIKWTPMERYTNCMNVWTPNYEHHKYEHHKYGHQTYEHPTSMNTTSMNTKRMNTKCMNTNCMNTYGHVYWLYEWMNTYGPVYHVDFVAEYLRTCIPYWCVEYLLTSILCVIEYLLTSIPCGCCWKPLKQCIMWMIKYLWTRWRYIREIYE